MKKICILAVFSVFLSGCMSHVVQDYSPSFDNVSQLNKIRNATSHSIKIQDFTATKPGQRYIACRLEGIEKLPNGQSYEEYIQKALSDELTASGLLSDKAKTTLTGNLDKIDFDSMKGFWHIQMTFNSNYGKPFTVTSDYSFSSGFIADMACEQVASAFVPAVQKFISTLYSNSNFQALLKSTK